jgi:hypothetical protein
MKSSRYALHPLAATLLLALTPLALHAQIELAQQQKLPPVRQVGPISARSSEPMGAVSTAVPLPGGKVLVNDILNRRVVMFDSTLSKVTVVADSTSATANAYGARGGGLLPWGGDSALFVDPASLSMMVINGSGEIGRVMAVPRPNEVGLMVGGPNGRPGFDANGRLVFRGRAVARPGARGGAGQGQGARGGGAGARGGANIGGMTLMIPEQPDSAPVVRVDLATRMLDTVGEAKIQRADIQVTEGSDGRPNIQVRQNPIQMVDDWALLSDGSIVFVRGADFSIERVDASGDRTRSGKLPFEWQRLDEEAKVALLDSARLAIERQREEARRLVNEAGGPMQFIQGGGAERVMGGDGPRGGGAGDRGAAAARGGGAAPGSSANGAPPQRGAPAQGPAAGQTGFQIPPVNLVPASELPDYRPPFTAGSSLGDLEGNLWVRTSLPVGEHGPIYYVINTKFEVIDRVQVPQGRMVAGFGKGGVLYLAFRDLEGNNRLESAKWK